MNAEYYSIVIFVPEESADDIRSVLSTSGAGSMNNYDSCSFSSKGIGRFRPLEGSNPTIGTTNTISEVPEERIETICCKDTLQATINNVLEAHPYEEPAIYITPLLDYKNI